MIRPRSYISLSGISAVILGLVILFLFLATGGLLDLKMMQLRQLIDRERIMNLELSSRALRGKLYRLRTEQNNIDAELSRNLLESRVLNPSREGGTNYEGFMPALIMANGVRMLTFKEPLQLRANEQKLMALKLAFYFERSRRYEEALKIYSRLNPEDFPEPFPAFLQLHRGFCYLALGREETARPLLVYVLEEYPATHFARTSRFLLNFLERQARENKKLQGMEPLEAANALFASGNCSAALEYYNRILKTGVALSPSDNFRRALCLEETGDLEESVKLYRTLAGGGPHAREANARLLMIGHFYGGGPEIREEAEQRARFMGDTDLLSRVQITSRDSRAPLVVDEIKKWQQDSDASQGILKEIVTDPDPSLQKELQKYEIDAVSLGLPGKEEPGRPGTDTVTAEKPQKDATDAENQEPRAYNRTDGVEKSASSKPPVDASPSRTGPGSNTSEKEKKEPTDGQEVTWKDSRPESRARNEQLKRLQEMAAGGPSADDYELSMPGLKRWPATVRLESGSLTFLLITQDLQGNFKTGKGKLLRLEDLAVIQAHPEGSILLRLKDGRKFLLDRVSLQDGYFQAGPFRFPPALVYQIAAY